MSNLPSARRAERMQAAKREFIPPFWPVLLVLTVLVVLAVWVVR